MPKNGQVTIRELELIGQHETKIALIGQSIESINKSISKIETNHLAHIQDSIENINLKLASLDPQNKLVSKLIEIALIAILSALLGLVLIKSIV